MLRIIEEFRGLAWSEVKPNYLDYANAQILLIGENTDKGVEATTKDQKHDKEAPKEELDRLEHEDELRVEHLHGKCVGGLRKICGLAKLRQVMIPSSTILRSAARNTPRFQLPGRAEVTMIVSHKR